MLLLLTVLTDNWRAGIDAFWPTGLRGGTGDCWIAPDRYGPFPPVEEVIAVTLLRIEAVRVMTPSLDGPVARSACRLGATGNESVLSFDSKVSARWKELRTSRHFEFLV